MSTVVDIHLECSGKISMNSCEQGRHNYRIEEKDLGLNILREVNGWLIKQQH